MKLTDYSTDLASHLSFSRAIRARAERLTRSIHDRGFALAQTVGIPRDMCCLHNASIDDQMRGWCANNPERLKVAKLASLIVSDWTPTRLADSLISRDWNRLAKKHGLCCSVNHGLVKPFNRHLLFIVV